MSTSAPTRRDLTGQAVIAASTRRVAALARAELLLLSRTPIALVTAVVMPIAMVLLFRASVPPELVGGAGIGPFVVVSLTGTSLLLVVYYTLVTAVVARREELVLKRLRCGELSDAEVLAGTVAPRVLIAWVQVAAALVAAFVAWDMPAPANPLLLLVAVGAGTAVMVVLALASAALSTTVQSAELTTAPLIVASLALGGLMMPVDLFPETLQRVSQALPLTAVCDLVRLGLSGTTPDGDVVGLAASFSAAAAPTAILAAWFLVGLWATRRLFRWEPRR
jgi:ABC-2 type transport system permease protein